MIPLDLLPGAMGTVAPYLPFSGIIYYPVMIYLQLTPPTGIWVQIAWSLALTGSALLLTRMARRKLEIQGG
jgi:ABC-2 type transport system permease protein